MGLFDWIYKRTPASETKVTEVTPEKEIVSEPKILEREKYIEIPSKKYSGMSVKSPNCVFTLTWESDLGEGKPNRGLRYFLMRGSKIIVEGKIKRPGSGKVSNSGVFVIHEDGPMDELCGVFCAFDATGMSMVRRKLNANLYNSDLSADGRMAVCHTCNSNDVNDSSILVIFDLENGIELAKWRPESGWPQFYEFSSDGKVISLGYTDLGVFKYSIDGVFLEKEVWQDACLFKGKSWHALVMVESILKEVGSHLSVEMATKLLKALDRAFPEIRSEDVKAQAKANKFKGMCLEFQGDLKDALACYVIALGLDEKIGVKQRATKVRKLLNS